MKSADRGAAQPSVAVSTVEPSTVGNRGSRGRGRQPSSQTAADPDRRRPCHDKMSRRDATAPAEHIPSPTDRFLGAQIPTHAHGILAHCSSSKVETTLVPTRQSLLLYHQGHMRAMKHLLPGIPHHGGISPRSTEYMIPWQTRLVRLSSSHLGPPFRPPYTTSLTMSDLRMGSAPDLPASTQVNSLGHMLVTANRKREKLSQAAQVLGLALAPRRSTAYLSRIGDSD